MPDVVTVGAITSMWKLLGSLYDKYQSWSVRTKRSKEAQEKKARAQALMKQINEAILAGASSDDPEVAVLVREFRALVADDIKPDGHEYTEGWVVKSRRSDQYINLPAKREAPAKRPAAKKAAAKQAAAKKAASKKAAAKKPAAKRA